MAHKRSHEEFATDDPADGLTSNKVTPVPLATKLQNDHIDDQNDDGWQVVEARGSKRRKKTPRKESEKYPSITHSPNARPQSLLSLSALQNLVLYLLADGNGPQWCSIKNHANFRKVVVLLVPGLEMGMFDGSIALDSKLNTLPKDVLDKIMANDDSALKQKGYATPEDYYPKRITQLDLPAALEPLKDIFDHVWPVKTPGDDRFGRMHSPLSTILTVPLRQDKEDKTAKSKGPGTPAAAKNWHDQRTPITALLLSSAEQLDAGYVLHPTHFAGDPEAAISYEKRRMRDKTSTEDGWKDSPGTTTLDDGALPDNEVEKGSTLEGRTVFALDCEMCITSPKGVKPDVYSLTRLSVIDWNGNVVLDELVKPKDVITDYVTAYSGITAEMLENVTTTQEQAQAMMLAMLTPHTILVGHSLDSDLKQLKITHPFIVDTAILYPHPRGPPLKSSLKWLSQKYLGRAIQTGGGTTGHDSIEDSLATLDLVKQKCDKGKTWGTSDANMESIFQRLSRTIRPKRFKRHPDGEDEPHTGAVVDWGDPRRGFGGHAKVAIPCQNDEDVAKGIAAAINGGSMHDQIPVEGVDFVWGRMRELDAYCQWWKVARSSDSVELRAAALAKNVDKSLGEVVADTVARIEQVWEALPACTAFIVYSGSGDPRRLAELQEQKQNHKNEYAIKKWDELTTHWTDKEEYELKRACEIARRGIGFIAVK